MSSFTHSPGRFLLPHLLWQAMLDHVLACLPEEACGLVGSAQSDVPAGPSPVNGPQTIAAVTVLPVENELHSPVRFRMAPAEQLKAFYRLEEQKLELAAIYHSHPQGPVHPSVTDLAEFAYPGVWMVIVSPLDPASSKNTPALKNAAAAFVAGWQARVFRIDDSLSSGLSASEVPLVLLPEPQRGAS